MTYQRQAWCFLGRTATTEGIGTVLHSYKPAGDMTFVAGADDSLECIGPGFGVRVTSIRKLRALLAEVKAVGKRVDEIRTSAMVIVIDVEIDPAAYRETVYSQGVGRPGLPWQALGAIEALNVMLQQHRAITYDRDGGFYPSA